MFKDGAKAHKSTNFEKLIMNPLYLMQTKVQCIVVLEMIAIKIFE